MGTCVDGQGKVVSVDDQAGVLRVVRQCYEAGGWVSKFGVVVDRREQVIRVGSPPVLYGRRRCDTLDNDAMHLVTK